MAEQVIIGQKTGNKQIPLNTPFVGNVSLTSVIIQSYKNYSLFLHSKPLGSINGPQK